MKYKVLRQHPIDERSFDLKSEKGDEIANVDIFTGGGLIYDESEVETTEKYLNYLKSFVGKTIDIPRIYPRAYFTSGNIKIIE